MARTTQTLQEAETVIRFDETDDPAILWTASARVRKEWEGYGFKPVVSGSGWRVEVPKDRVTYRVLGKSVKKA